MIDTVILISPKISDEVCNQVVKACQKKYAIDCESGEILYEFTAASLTNSADNRISLQIKDYDWIKGSNDVTASKVDCDRYLRVECSIHKQMLGHNIFGGSSDFKMCVKWLILHLNEVLECKLPDYKYWLVDKIDTTETYDLGSEKAVKSWFRHMNNAEYSRRYEKIQRYGDVGLYIPGSTTTLKFYHKGTEFWIHDRKKAKRILDFVQVNKLQDIANRILRVEVSIKSRKLKYLFGRRPFVAEIEDDLLKKIYDEEVNKILKGFNGDEKMIRKTEAVEKRLYEVYNERLAGLLLGTWMRLSTLGEKYTKSRMKETTFYRQRKQLLDAGITWLGTDIEIIDCDYPVDFKPVRGNECWMPYVLPEIQEKIEKVRAA